MKANDLNEIVGNKPHEINAEKLLNSFKNKCHKNEKVVYKLFRKSRKDDLLYPLYVLADKPTSVGIWLPAEEGIIKNNGKVKAKGGELSFRPGWHSCELPVARHIGEKANAYDSYPSYRPANQVWCVCLIKTAMHTFWQQKAELEGKTMRDKCLKEIPVGGFYRYQTNQNANVDWYISGELKVLRELSQKEVVAINNLANVQDLPRLTRYSMDGSIL